MSDNWSLKGRKYAVMEDYTYENYDWIQDKSYVGKRVYLEEDIEIIRQKLIGDLFDILKEEIERSHLSNRSVLITELDSIPEIRMTVHEALKYVERAINKRFGVIDD